MSIKQPAKVPNFLGKVYNYVRLVYFQHWLYIKVLIGAYLKDTIA
jgi:hypothetical protein